MVSNAQPESKETYRDSSTVGLLLSGGLDSSILLGQLNRMGHTIQPFYTKFGLYWESAELHAVQKFLDAVASPSIRPLVVFELPLADIYGEHWSVTGHDVPDFQSPDQAVFLPGRNALLAIKAAFWCQMHHVRDLALATLSSNPFPDATARFFRDLESVLKTALSADLRLLRPFEHFSKRQVMQAGRGLPLELTFSCIAPIGGLHCGSCNKCVERMNAFRLIEHVDPTEYVNVSASHLNTDRGQMVKAR